MKKIIRLIKIKGKKFKGLIFNKNQRYVLKLEIKPSIQKEISVTLPNLSLLSHVQPNFEKHTTHKYSHTLYVSRLTRTMMASWTRARF